MAELTVPPSINDARSAALLVLIDRLELIDLVPLLVYRIDSVPAGALPFLAWQFDILSPLWQSVAPAIESVDALTDYRSAFGDRHADRNDVAGGGGRGGRGRAQLDQDGDRAFTATAGRRGRLKTHSRRSDGRAFRCSRDRRAGAAPNTRRTRDGRCFGCSSSSATSRLTDPSAVTTAVAAVNFFKPARSWLDSLWFVLPPASDAVAAPLDRLTLGGIAEYQLDNAPTPSDAALSLAVTLAPLTDSYGPTAPLYDAHYLHSGITYGRGRAGGGRFGADGKWRRGAGRRMSGAAVPEGKRPPPRRQIARSEARRRRVSPTEDAMKPFSYKIVRPLREIQNLWLSARNPGAALGRRAPCAVCRPPARLDPQGAQPVRQRGPARTRGAARRRHHGRVRGGGRLRLGIQRAVAHRHRAHRAGLLQGSRLACGGRRRQRHVQLEPDHFRHGRGRESRFRSWGCSRIIPRWGCPARVSRTQCLARKTISPIAFTSGMSLTGTWTLNLLAGGGAGDGNPDR